MIYKELAEIFQKSGRDSIPEHCAELAKEYESRIAEILAGKDLTEQWKRDRLFINVMYFYRNIEDKSNERIEEWLDHDKDAAKLFMKLTTEYESCGWHDISIAPFNFENETSKRLLDELYVNAVEFFKKERVTN